MTAREHPQPSSLILEQRLRQLVRSWPKPMLQDSWEHVLARCPASAPDARSAERLWMLLPGWLLDHFRSRPGQRQTDTDFLTEVLWGQYCLFLSVGIHDDLFDGQARRPSLVFVADELLIESQCAYAKYFREGPFWSIYRDCVRQTTKALVEADSQQRSLYASRKRMLGCYARAAAIFKIGSAAVCLKRRRMRSFSHIARFLEEMAIAGQILDDLEDMEEDLERGRYNFAANTLLRRRPQLKRRQARRLIAEGVMLKGMLAELVHEVRHRIENAAHAIAPLRLKAADRYIALRGRDVDELENILLRARAELLLRAI